MITSGHMLGKRGAAIVYLSPHPDDAALSCGGLIHQQTQSALSVEIITICAGYPPVEPLSDFAEDLHARWGVGREALEVRRAEDLASCALLGASSVQWDYLDAIYRRDGRSGIEFITRNEDLFQELPVSERYLIEALAEDLAAYLSPDATVICPLTWGNHVDHQLVRQAAERLDRTLWFYSDFPYVVTRQADIDHLIPAGYQPQLFALSEEDRLAWLASIVAHHSQISSFWGDVAAMENELRNYESESGGVILFGMKHS